MHADPEGGMTATVEGLTTDQVREATRAGRSNTPVSGSGRTTGRILRTTVFSFYNNTLFVIGIALLALGRYSDALVSVGLGIINAALAAFQELRAKRQLDRLQLLACRARPARAARACSAPRPSAPTATPAA
jgi:cation-transporting ATPase E